MCYGVRWFMGRYFSTIKNFPAIWICFLYFFGHWLAQLLKRRISINDVEFQKWNILETDPEPICIWFTIILSIVFVWHLYNTSNSWFSDDRNLNFLFGSCEQNSRSHLSSWHTDIKYLCKDEAILYEAKPVCCLISLSWQMSSIRKVAMFIWVSLSSLWRHPGSIWSTNLFD